VKLLIVEGQQDRAQIWAGALERAGARVQIASGQAAAVARLGAEGFDLVILNIVLPEGSALAVADLVQFRHPATRIIFVTGGGFFSDGSIFNLCANACACVPETTAPADLVVMAAHYARPPEAPAQTG
jgi:DNA-binding NtrC family response regulator